MYLSDPTPTPSFFRPIGEHAADTDALADDDGDDGGRLETEVNGEVHPVEEIESLCMECHENGITRLLLTYIPYFREVVVVSFRCEHCGHANNDIQSAGSIQERGSVYTVKLTDRSDLDRQLVKSDTCTVSIPEYKLEIPASKGQFTTIEGLISDTIRDLSHDQEARKVDHPEVYAGIEALLDKLKVICPLEDGNARVAELPPIPFLTLRLDDPAGNSFISAVGGLSDPKWSKREYVRSEEQNGMLGLPTRQGHDDHNGIMPEEVLSFPTTCSSCGSTLETYMKNIDIPHFKEVIIMSTNCHSCGYRDNEIKSGGAIAPLGRKITLKVEDTDDLARDILKSETASLAVPEIDLELNPGTLGGRFTTVEGLLNQVYEELDDKVFAISKGDSAASVASDQNIMAVFLGRLKQVIAAEIPYTLVLDDPLSNSYIQNLYAPDPDPNMETEEYERTHEQNEELGLNDMRVDEYKDAEGEVTYDKPVEAAAMEEDAVA